MSTVVTSEHLLQKLRELLTQTSINNLTLKKLTDHCAVSRSTIYRNFPGGMPDLCLALLQQDLEYLLQQQLADWQQMVEFSINFIEHHRVRCLNFYHLLILQNQEINSQDTITKLLELYLAQTLQSQFNYQLLKKHSVEIKFVVGGILYQLKKWFDSQLKLAAVDVIESMNCGLSLLEDTLIMEH